MTAEHGWPALADADDETLRLALGEVEYSALRTTLYALTGDRAYCAEMPLRMEAMSGRVALPELTDEGDRVWLRERAFEVLRALRNGKISAQPPQRAELATCLRLLLGREVPEADHDFWWEELAVDPLPRASEWYGKGAWDDPDEKADHTTVLVIGAGIGGVTAAVHLKAAGISFRLVDSQATAGGTWAQNRYPGIRIDLTSRAYNFSFAPNWKWRDYFATGAEICAYIDACIDAHGLRKHIDFGLEVVSMTWDEGEGLWTTVLRADAAQHTHRSRAVVAATGLFGRPKFPAIQGLGDFSGELVHTSAWRDGIELSGKRVGLLGTGSSGVQIAAGLAEAASSLSVFQRTGAWVGGNPDYTKSIPDSERWLTQHLPYYGHWLRVQSCYTIGDERIQLFQVDPEWDTPGSVSALNLALREQMTSYIISQLGDRADLRAQCIPSWPPLSRRTPLDNGWFAALREPHVDLVTTPIDRFDAEGAVLADGRKVPLDVLVLATGYWTERFLWPVEVAGAGGRTLREAWAGGPSAYLGMMVPDFPNLFLLYGPNTNPITGGIPLYEELAVRYALNCLELLRSRGWRSVSVRADVCRAYNEALDAALDRTVYSRGGQGSYYYDSHGRNITQFPFATSDYWRWTRRVDVDDLVVDEGQR